MTEMQSAKLCSNCWSRTASRVCTSEWVDGAVLRDAETLAAAGHDPGLGGFRKQQPVLLAEARKSPAKSPAKDDMGGEPPKPTQLSLF